MKALFFLNSFVGGGAEKVCLNLAKQLYQFGMESDFVTIYNRKPDYDIPKYVHVFSLDIENRPGEHWDVIRAVPKVNEFISGKEYALITAHVQPSQLLASLTTAGRKTLYVMHKSRHRADEHSSWYQRMALKSFLKGKKIVSVSRGVGEELKHEFGIRAENIATIYNPCGVKALKSEPKLPSLHTRPYILVMGRLVEQKNPLLALELYHEGRFYENYDLIYLGKGPLEDSLKKQVAECQMQKHVLIAGFQKNPEQWMKNASLLLSCSRQEGFGMNLAEALICGIPVVSSDCPYGPGEILTGELSKYLINPEKDFQKSISVISSALKFYPEITEKYYKKFEDEQIAEMYLKVWEKNFI